MRVALALLVAVASGCAADTARRPTLVDNPFMATFEAVQVDGGEMITSHTDESGHVTILRAASVSMDQMVYIWGPDHPAVPIFFSGRLAMRFAIFAGIATQKKMPEKEAQAWAWKKLHEPRKPRAPQ